MYYLETSAKEAENVEKLFMKIASDLMHVSVQIIVIINLIDTAKRVGSLPTMCRLGLLDFIEFELNITLQI